MGARAKKKSVESNNKELVLQRVEPKTFSQRRAFKSFSKGKNLMMYGTAGTGKTFLALYFALKDVLDKRLYDRCVVFRSSVASRSLGFLPGNAGQKMKVFEEPYQAIAADLFDRDGAYQVLKQRGYLQFASTSYMRGTTIDDAIVIIDEFQNMSWQEIKTICTRIGENCRIVVCGDMRQTDLHVSGGKKLIEVTKKMSSFEFIEFFKEDVLRSGFVRDFLSICEEMGYQ